MLTAEQNERHLSSTSPSPMGCQYRRINSPHGQLLGEQIKTVEDGGEPINTFRDPEANQSIDTTVEKSIGFFARLKGSRVHRTLGARKYSPIYWEATRRIEGEDALSRPIS